MHTQNNLNKKENRPFAFEASGDEYNKGSS